MDSIKSKISPMNKWVVLLLAVSFILASIFITYLVANSSFEKRIIRLAKHDCTQLDGEGCVIDIANVTNFEWDEMYVFSFGESDDIEEVLGIKPEKSSVSRRKIVFMLDKKIVYYEEFRTNIEHSVNGQIYFDPQVDSWYKVYTPQNAMFNIQVRESRYGSVYDLVQVKL